MASEGPFRIHAAGSAHTLPHLLAMSFVSRFQHIRGLTHSPNASGDSSDIRIGQNSLDSLGLESLRGCEIRLIEKGPQSR